MNILTELPLFNIVSTCNCYNTANYCKYKTKNYSSNNHCYYNYPWPFLTNLTIACRHQCDIFKRNNMILHFERKNCKHFRNNDNSQTII